MRIGLLALAAAVSELIGPAGAANQPIGRENIVGMAGCYAVTYRFYEDGQHDHFNEGYGLSTSIKELITIVEDGPAQVTLQHSSIEKDGQLVPHWHEEWVYGGAGWTQTVFSITPDDELRQQRYACTAHWSLNRWQCHAGRSVKPFRDDGAPFGFLRTDYEWLDRDNTLLVTPGGWVQSEHNRKRNAEGGLVSYEIGLIIYDRLADAECGVADAGEEPLVPQP